jgi:hypothetical protein
MYRSAARTPSAKVIFSLHPATESEKFRFISFLPLY